MRLTDALASVGLFVVRKGALEGWAPHIGKHGAAFVEAALAEGVHATNTELRDFVISA